MTARHALLICLLLPASCAAASRDQGMSAVPRDYFGLHCNDCSSPTLYGSPTTPYPELNQGAVRLWDSGTTWRLVEPRRRLFDWSRLDQEVRQNEDAGVETFLTLGQTPDYCATARGERQYNPNPPTDDADGDACWTEYVEALTRRYADRIRYYGIWNEPDQGGWSGSTGQLVRLARLAYPIIKSNAPRSLVMSPEFGPPLPYLLKRPVNLKLYLASGGGRYMDALAIHFYPGDGERPEYALGRIQDTRSLLDARGYAKVAMYDTEDGPRGWRDTDGAPRNMPPYASGHKDWLPDDVVVAGGKINLQSAYVTRQYLIMLGSGLVKQSYYYTFDNPDGTSGSASVMAVGMIDYPAEPRTLLPPALAYRYLAGLLRGGKVSRVRTSGRLWSIDFATADGRNGRVYWCDDYSTAEIQDLSAVSATDNIGQEVGFDRNAVRITGSPLFLFYSSRRLSAHGAGTASPARPFRSRPARG